MKNDSLENLAAMAGDPIPGNVAAVAERPAPAVDSQTAWLREVFADRIVSKLLSDELPAVVGELMRLHSVSGVLSAIHNVALHNVAVFDVNGNDVEAGQAWQHVAAAVDTAGRVANRESL